MPPSLYDIILESERAFYKTFFVHHPKKKFKLQIANKNICQNLLSVSEKNLNVIISQLSAEFQRL